jgi:hypothetical protein
MVTILRASAYEKIEAVVRFSAGRRSTSAVADIAMNERVSRIAVERIEFVPAADVDRVR